MIIVDLAVQYWYIWLIIALASMLSALYCQLRFMKEGIGKLDFFEAIGRIWPVMIFGIILLISGAMLLIALAIAILRAVF